MGWVGIGDYRRTVVTEAFSTIRSPTFSELVIVITNHELPNLPWDATMFETLRKMNEIRPFRLVFLAEAPGSYQEKLRQCLEGPLNLATAQGFFDYSILYQPAV